jgi:glycosyltransferase involved in cell wall biosynthesis
MSCDAFGAGPHTTSFKYESEGYNHARHWIELNSTMRTAAGCLLTFADHLGSVGGTEASQLAILRALADHGWDVDLFYQSIGDHWPSWQSFVSQTTEVRGSLPARDAPVSSTLGVVRSIRSGVRHRPSVIYVHNAGDVPVALTIGRFVGAPVVAHIHLPPPVNQPRWLNAFLRRADEVIVPSDDTSLRWSQRAGLHADRLSSIPTGVDLERFRPLPVSERASIRAALDVSPAEDMILYVGRLERIKGVHFLLEAAHRMTTTPKVVVCGAATEPDYQEELMHAGGNTTFLGRRSDIPELMAAADLLVLPSDVAETQGLVVHESMACGTPVVASDVGGLTASMAGFPDQLVKPADAVALSEVITRVLRWRHDDPGLSERSREWVRTHMSIAMTGDAVHAILSRAIDPRVRGGSSPDSESPAARMPRRRGPGKSLEHIRSGPLSGAQGTAETR